MKHVTSYTTGRHHRCTQQPALRRCERRTSMLLIIYTSLSYVHNVISLANTTPSTGMLCKWPISMLQLARSRRALIRSVCQKIIFHNYDLERNYRSIFARERAGALSSSARSRKSAVNIKAKRHGTGKGGITRRGQTL